MKVKVISEIPSARGVIPTGRIIEISAAMLEKLQGKVEPLPITRPNGGKDLPHYCQPGECWCSEKLPQSNYPSGCIRIKCEYQQVKTQGADPLIPIVAEQKKGGASALPAMLPTFDGISPMAEDSYPEPEHLPRSCRRCGSTDMWLTASKYPQWRCRRCHPPVDGAENISARPHQDVPQASNTTADTVEAYPFVCRACGSTNWRGGIVARICSDCQVPEKI